MRSNEAYQQFLKVFEQFSYRHSYGETFTNFLDFSLYMLTAEKTADDHETMQRLERTYTEKKEAEQMAQLFIHFQNAADNDGEGFKDVLGDLFMELVSHGRNGQYFTPQPICDMMAEMTHGGELTAGQEVSDPACGSGRMLMAMAKKERHLKFFGADNDSTCCKMAVLNLVLNTMEGEIAHMNSLSMEHYKSWHVKKMRLGTHYVPLLYTTGKGITGFIVHKEPEQQATAQAMPAKQPERIIIQSGVQMDLFNIAS